MTRRDFPLWFKSDVIAFIGVMATYWTLITINDWVHRRVIARATRRHLTKLEFKLLAHILAIAESWLAWALQRQALRANGRDADTAKAQHISPATTLAAFKTRCRRYVDDVVDIDAPARRAAANLARAMREPAPILPRSRGRWREATDGGGHVGIPSAIPSPHPPIPASPYFPRTRGKMARAPPHIRRTTNIRQMPQELPLLRSRPFRPQPTGHMDFRPRFWSIPG